MNSQELNEIINSVNKNLISNELYAKLVVEQAKAQEREQRQAEEDARRSEAIPIEVPDFSKVKPGTLVTRSEHYIKQSLGKNRGQIGIVTKINIYKDDLSVASYWPDVHWEGEYSSAFSHPLNVELANGKQLPKIIMNNNQQDFKF